MAKDYQNIIKKSYRDDIKELKAEKEAIEAENKKRLEEIEKKLTEKSKKRIDSLDDKIAKKRTKAEKKLAESLYLDELNALKDKGLSTKEAQLSINPGFTSRASKELKDLEKE